MWGGGAHLGCLEFHQRAPLAVDLAELGGAVFHPAGDGVVRAGEETFRLEFEVGLEILRVVAHGARVSEFDDHLSEEDSAPVHVRHRHHVLYKKASRPQPPGGTSKHGKSATRSSMG